MRRRDELHRHVVLTAQRRHHVEQRRYNAPLPLWMEVSLDLIHQEDDLPCRINPQVLAGGQVLLPRPNQKIGQGDDTAHSRRGVDQRHVHGVGHP